MEKNLKKFGVVFSLLAFSLFAFTSCQKTDLQSLVTANAGAKSPAAGKGEMSIGMIADGNGNFTQLVDALDYTGLLDMFVNGKDQYTVFAPTDAAFNTLYTALNISSIRDLPADFVTKVLLYHVTDGRRFSNSVLPKNSMKRIETLLGLPFYVNSTGGIDTNDSDDMVNATISTPDLSASNGVIHVINAVLVPTE